jgi:uncharacterized protein YyaL (SSP411 family)
MWDERGRTLFRRYRAGDAAVPAYAEDYACLVFALLELFQADGAPDWLEWALTLQSRQDELFWDHDGGGWFSTTGTDPSLLMRLKDDYDAAEPAASSMSVLNAVTLSHLAPGDESGDRIARVFSAFARKLTRMGPALPFMLTALQAHHAGLSQVVVAGLDDRADTAALLDVLATSYRPFSVVMHVRPGDTRESWARLLPFVAAMRPVNGHSAAYVCRDFTCQQPATSPEELRAQLETIRAK